MTRGCSQCHSIDGSKGQGPTWKGLYKRDHEFSKSDVAGYTLKESDDDKKWDDYLRESILHPEAKIVQGLPERHASPGVDVQRIAGQREKLQAIIEYIKSLGDPKYYKPMKTPESPEVEKARRRLTSRRP